MNIRYRFGAWTGAAALAALGMSAAAAHAQDAVERCRQSADDQARIACLEAALQQQSEPAPAVVPPPAEPSAAAPSRELGAEQVAARASVRSAEPSERVQARLAAAETIPFRRLQLTLDNGQVWRQIEGDTQRVSVRADTDTSVEIWEARIGGYRMRLNELARTIRVERVR
jgi:hypothetical protein